MKYYLLQIKEGPHGGPFHDCVTKWISAGYAAVFTQENYANFDITRNSDVANFITTFAGDENNDSILLSIGADTAGIETLYIYCKAGTLQDITGIEVEDIYYKNIQKDKAIGFPIKLLHKIKVADCPLVLATIKSNTRLTMGTFKAIENPKLPYDPKNKNTHLNSYFGNIMAIKYLLTGQKQKVDSIEEYLECLSPIEFETLIAKLKEEEGFFVPAYKGGMLKDYDLICKKDDKIEKIQVKLNLSRDTYNKYKKKDLCIYCVSSFIKQKENKQEEAVIFDYNKVFELLKRSPNTRKWLMQSLDWIDFSF